MSFVSMRNYGKVVRKRDDTLCEWCGGPLPSGRLAVVRNYMFGGEFVYAHQHLTCFDIMNQGDNSAFTPYVNKPIEILDND